jgi:hypothetical protein
VVRRLDGEHDQLVAHADGRRQTREVSDFLQNRPSGDAVTRQEGHEQDSAIQNTL